VDLQDKARALARRIEGTPGFCQNSIHNNHPGIDPNNRQVHENEEHVDGRIDPVVIFLDEQDPAAMIQPGAEHQAQQAALETCAIPDRKFTG